MKDCGSDHSDRSSLAFSDDSLSSSNILWPGQELSANSVIKNCASHTDHRESRLSPDSLSKCLMILRFEIGWGFEASDRFENATESIGIISRAQWWWLLVEVSCRCLWIHLLLAIKFSNIVSCDGGHLTRIEVQKSSVGQNREVIEISFFYLNSQTTFQQTFFFILFHFSNIHVKQSNQSKKCELVLLT